MFIFFPLLVRDARSVDCRYVNKSVGGLRLDVMNGVKRRSSAGVHFPLTDPDTRTEA